MKIRLLSTMAVLAALVISALSCSKNDDGGEPAGAISLNMMDETNGKTLLGNSDVYIDKANNFYSGYSCVISSLGKKGGLRDAAPALSVVNDKIAVEAGYAYQIFRDDAVREFPSGNLALNIKADYYNVYVVSPLKQENKTVGANVKFALSRVPGYGLPAYDSEMEKPDLYFYECEVNLPTSDFEYDPDVTGRNQIQFEKQGKKLVAWIDPNEGGYYGHETFGIYIRIKGSYTYVTGIL